MSIKRSLRCLQFFMAALMLIAGILLLTGCQTALDKPKAVFPESITTKNIELPFTDKLPVISASDFIQDPDGVCAIAELVGDYDFKAAGDYSLEIKVTASNSAEKTMTAVLTLYSDTEAPVFSGVADKRFAVTDKISYIKGITATDAHDGEVSVSVDNSAIKFDEKNQPVPGMYKVVYTATDKAGNVATAEATFIFSLESITDEMIDAAVKGVLDQLITPTMSQADKAWAIYLYTYRNVEYTGSSEKGDYRAEAYRGIVNKQGDCFTYHSVSKALLLAAGITDIIDVTRAEGGPMDASHYWLLVNLGSGYYHFDTTRKAEWQDGFMQTDAQLDAYEKKKESLKGFFYRDKSLYPETPKAYFDYVKDYNIAK